MQLVITAKIRIYPDEKQAATLEETMEVYRDACNYVSAFVFDTGEADYYALHRQLYGTLRDMFGLRAQMTQSVLKTVVARYDTLKKSGHPRTQIVFKAPCVDLVRGKDYSFTQGRISVGSLTGRQKVLYTTKGMEQFFDPDIFRFGTAKVVHKKSRKKDLWFLHIPVEFEVPDCDIKNPAAIVGCDLGINFTLTAFDSDGHTTFFPGRVLKHKRVKFKTLRRDLQKRGTPSARRRLKRIGQRENRWMQDVNHCVSKTLVSSYPSGTLFVLEDLTGIRKATEKLHPEFPEVLQLGLGEC